MAVITRGGRKPLALFVAAVFCLALCPALAFASPLGAASLDGGDAGSTLQTTGSKNMKARGVKFDLKVGKPVTCYKTYKGVGKIRYTATVSKVKVIKNDDGTKTATITMTHKLKKNPTSKQVNAFFKTLTQHGSMKAIEAPLWDHFVDYKTGKSLECPESVRGVTWEIVSYKNVPTKTYRASNGARFYLKKKSTLQYKITFPKSYRGLCIGMGCGTVAYNDMNKYDRGYANAASPKYTYFKTTLFKNEKKSNHFMRVV